MKCAGWEFARSETTEMTTTTNIAIGDIRRNGETRSSSMRAYSSRQVRTFRLVPELLKPMDMGEQATEARPWPRKTQSVL